MMIDFVVCVSYDLRPYVLDTRVKRGAELSTDHHLVVSWIRWQRRKLDRPGRPKRIACEGLLGTSGRGALCQGGGRSSTPTSGRASHRFRGRLETLSPSGPCSLPPLSTRFEVVDARSLVPVVWRQLPEPVVVDTGIDRYRQAKQAAARTVLEAKTRVWEEFGEAMEEDYRSASKRFWQTVRRLRRGKQYSANTVYSAGGELLTSTGDIVGRWKKYFEDLLNPTDLPSNEEAEAGVSEVDSSITQAEVTEVVREAPAVARWRRGWMRSALSTSNLWMLWGCLVLADTPLQHCMEVGDSASGVANWGGGPSLGLKRGTGECVPTTGGSHFSASPEEGLRQGTGEENSGR
ncbi:hypothetical protein L3Q82_020902 [Scortum barcoo]|uniref:Uncharacterized protein n=1 Tax=Scortum barcoo TaxID=214431 RepID=A0ACB8V9R2_9TELE|nr:hypothetical protein L3Q82_020902 [Scortum barcoo]